MHLQSVLASLQRVFRFHIMPKVNIFNNYFSDIAQTRSQIFGIRHCLVNRYQDCLNYAFAASFRFAQAGAQISHNAYSKYFKYLFLISHKLELRYLTFDIVWSTATRIVKIMHVPSVLASPQRVIRFHIMPKVNILNNFF